MEKELVTIGMIDRVEIWSKDVYDNSENGGKLTAEDLEKFSEEYRV
jgi:DNA-binding transcriptional regulator/RsmH inhibitor MraZ